MFCKDKSGSRREIFMKNAVIICEFNPLHNGHKRLLDKARESGAENVFCIMSGNAVQRGQLACLNKYVRARHAVLAGADVVLELPAEYTLSAAKQFALGGVKIANLIEDATLFFGSECGDASLLEKVALALSDESVNEKIKASLKEGTGYPKALADAIGEDLVDDCPNNVLGIEYIRAIIDTGRKISYATTIRDSSPSDNAPKGCVSSAVIRGTLSSDSGDCSEYVPSFVARDLKDANFDLNRLYDALRYIIISNKETGFYDDGEGLSRRLSRCALQAKYYEEFCSLACSRRYTRARVKRLMLNIAIKNTFTHKDLTEKPVNFVNLLAADKNKKHLLSQIGAPVAASGRQRERFADEYALTEATDTLYRSVFGFYKDENPFIDKA